MPAEAVVARNSMRDCTGHVVFQIANVKFIDYFIERRIIMLCVGFTYAQLNWAPFGQSHQRIHPQVAFGTEFAEFVPRHLLKQCGNCEAWRHSSSFPKRHFDCFHPNRPVLFTHIVTKIQPGRRFVVAPPVGMNA